jgi:hypothetical protein
VPQRSGGKREGAGRPYGSKNLATIAKEEAREFVRTYITEHLQPLLDAQIDNAIGIRHLMMHDPKTGKFERITGNAKQIDKAMKTKTVFWIYTKDPNIAAFTDLLNRAIDKPAEHIQVAGEGNITIVGRKIVPAPVRCLWSETACYGEKHGDSIITFRGSFCKRQDSACHRTNAKYTQAEGRAETFERA